MFKLKHRVRQIFFQIGKSKTKNIQVFVSGSTQTKETFLIILSMEFFGKTKRPF